jgi:hypothetical protein
MQNDQDKALYGKGRLIGLRFAVSSFRYQLSSWLCLPFKYTVLMYDAVNPSLYESQPYKRGKNLTPDTRTNIDDLFVKHCALLDNLLNIFSGTPATRQR